MPTYIVSNVKNTRNVVAIVPLCKNDFTKWLKLQPARIKNLISVNRFSAEPNTFCLITDSNGNLKKVLLGLKTPDDFLAFGVLPTALPAGQYYLDTPNFSPTQLEHAAIGWGLGSYQFTQYKKPKKITAKLLCKEKHEIKKINTLISTIFWIRDLINMPAYKMYPEKLAQEAEHLAKEFNAEFNKVTDDELRQNFPAVYAVGRGSENQPLLIDIHYGNENDPKIVLVGKGVCFDSGGLQLKSSTGMLGMKKDMAGAAYVLGLARMIMAAKLPVNMRVIIPAVENLISGGSLKPGDIITTRKGIHIEITNTDAEGRLILADALTFASEWKPKLILDIASLTTAARIALGPNITALFTPDNQLAKDIVAAMTIEQEPVWRMPLYQPYLEFLKSNIADFKNVSTSGQNGSAITAALLLQQFVTPGIQWAHFDIYGYNQKSLSGKPEGGEAECIRGLTRYIEQSFG